MSGPFLFICFRSFTVASFPLRKSFYFNTYFFLLGVFLYNPFQDISPLPEGDSNSIMQTSKVIEVSEDTREGFINQIDEVDSDEENEFYEREGDDDVDFQRNAFNIIIDDETE